MRMTRGLIFCLAFAAASAHSGRDARTQDVAALSILVGSDGRTWLWAPGEATPRLVRGVNDATAAALLREEAVIADRDGAPRLLRVDPETDPAPLPLIDRVRSAACNGERCLLVTGEDRVVSWHGGEATDALPALEDVAAVSLGANHALALTYTGSVWAWGSNDQGQLGASEVLESPEPLHVPELRGIVSIGAGSQHSVATMQDGTAWAWGGNQSGQLGQPDPAARTSPARIEGIERAVQAVALAERTLILTESGEVFSVGGGDWRVQPLRSPGEFVRLHPMGATALAERSDGRFWDCVEQREVPFPAAARADAELSGTVGGDPLSSNAAFVVGPGALADGDAFIAKRLESLGLSVQVVRQNELVDLETSELGLVVISASVRARQMDGAALAALRVPIVTWERFLYRPMGLTRDGLPSHSVANDDHLSIIRPRHSLAAGLDGNVRVLESRRLITVGETAADAEVVAVSRRGSAAVFGYEAGSRSVGGIVPARRVGLFLPPGAEQILSAEGAALFDAAIRWASSAPGESMEDPETPEVSGTILMVVADTPAGSCSSPSYTAGDAVNKGRMEALGFTVEGKESNCALADHATGKAMVFVSHTAGGALGPMFKSVPVPVAVQSAAIVDDMEMVADADRGTCSDPPDPPQQLNLTYIYPSASNHPIANGLSGVYTISSVAGWQDWGTPTPNGTQISRCFENPQSTGFVYELGAAMDGGFPAPARRTMWGFYAPINETYTQVGQDLFDRMILWTTNTTNQPPVVNAGPDQGATACEPPNTFPTSCPGDIITLPGYVFDDGLQEVTQINWTKVSGLGNVAFGSQNAATTTVVFDNTGQFVLQLSAYDGEFTRIDQVVVEVYGHGSNLPPVVSAGPDMAVVWPPPNGPAVGTLQGTVTDDGLPNPPGARTYLWTQVPPPPQCNPCVSFGTPTLLTTTVTFPAEGSYVLRLTASDSALSAYDDVVVTVKKAALLVVGDPTAPTAGDTYLRTRMETLGFPVVVENDNQADNGDANGKALVWLSSTVDTNALSGTPFLGTTVPVVVQMTGYADDLGLIQPNNSGTTNATQVVITAPTHTLAAGLQGTVPASTVASGYSYAVPGAAAVKALRVASVSDPYSSVLAYETGQLMYNNQPAPERRLFFGPQDSAIVASNANGKKLIDAAILWAGRTNAAPWVDAGPPKTGVVTVPLNLNGFVTDDGLPNPPAAFTSTWTKVTGPGDAFFGNVNQPATTVQVTSKGDYVLKLTGNDGAKSASDLTYVTFYPAGTNGAPSVSAGPNQTVRMPQVAILQANASDDGLPAPLTFVWSKTFGPGGVTFNPQGSLVTSASFDAPGVYVLKITATDSQLSASDEVQITVEATAPALFVSNDPGGTDLRAAQELGNLGFTLTLKNDQNVVPADLNGKALAVISASVNHLTPKMLDLAPALLATVVPVALWEEQIFDDLKMTGPAQFGFETGTSVSIALPSHPMAALLSGQQIVYSPAGVLEWGVPGPTAFKVATLPSDASKATVFGYERGSGLVNYPGPAARRVMVFAGTGSAYTSSGVALFRAAIKWVAQKPVPVLFVVNTDAPLSASDAAVKDRLAALGYEVIVKTWAALVGGPAGDAYGKAFVVASNTPVAYNKLLAVQTAVVVWEGSVMSAMNMVTSYGTSANQTELNFIDQFHPLSAGLGGVKTISTAAGSYTWGVPGSAAAKVALLSGDATNYGIFGYEVGANLISGTAADRRAGLFLTANSATQLNADGNAVLDAAFRWAASSDPDKDGLGTADEYRYGTDPHDADSNDDGILDGPSVDAGINPTSLDVDGDGLQNSVERNLVGTDPFDWDTDGDTRVDNTGIPPNGGPDCFPLDPARWNCPADVPGAPTITLIEPTNTIPFP